jgi:hypothetical protein
MMRRGCFVCAVGLGLLLQSGCDPIGPESIRANRAEYNIAIQHTNDQELLLNLVRSHYRDTLYFTTVERIAATQSMSRGLQATANASFLGNTPAVANPATQFISRSNTQGVTLGPAIIAVTENPTVFYAPIEGEKFVRQMMTPMNPDLLLLLVRSGQSIDRVLSVAVQEMNGLRNAPTASGGTPSYEPEFQDFRAAVSLLRQLQREENLDFGRSQDGKQVELRILHGAAMTPPAMQAKSLLKLQPNLDRFTIVAGVVRPDDHSIVLSTRSLIAAINYLSQGVEVPFRDIAAGRVRTTVHNDGKTPFDWQELLGGVFHVAFSDSQPDDASVAINYRGTWFYIPDNDLDSKSTFVLLTQLIALHSVPPAAGGPILSIAVGGG